MQPLLDVPPLLMTHHRHRQVVETGQAGNDGGIVGVVAVAVQFVEIREQPIYVVQGVGPQGVAGYLRDLPGAEGGEDGAGQILAALLQASDFVLDVQLLVAAHMAQFLDLGLQLRHRLLEIEEIHCLVLLLHHGTGSPKRARKRVFFPILPHFCRTCRSERGSRRGGARPCSIRGAIPGRPKPHCRHPSRPASPQATRR